MCVLDERKKKQQGPSSSSGSVSADQGHSFTPPSSERHVHAEDKEGSRSQKQQSGDSPEVSSPAKKNPRAVLGRIHRDKVPGRR
jgi:hypothetical protein